ncbi:MAG: hypothetical protein UX31_C0003G0026 [Candidatus Nomurabacteria bacterium GW2011_GWA1_46_11]|uniref:DUF4352 domain-containing protein n=1 Tax=Candidatus Nomurabacteria bacterium GW2011_GWA1_46_11 TaxID=1618732 RepID=A0A0G1RN57_9BACT|nr:MAG: hypothetical protein UW69_C0026G0003 [Microgenomates group bacterium GW2011_GWA2_44_7]KKT78302.1 MAG: hypothetical protein UW73_C0004G0026 [Microgenomates group bacterium GW2011_GWB1_44_8]KKU22360.1 MAG: hypothetical protein UX31_C0003G0026 [Candidatus Nomurabacteria bacterium GW2011_GWA1_46_11]
MRIENNSEQDTYNPKSSRAGVFGFPFEAFGPSRSNIKNLIRDQIAALDTKSVIKRLKKLLPIFIILLMVLFALKWTRGKFVSSGQTSAKVNQTISLQTARAQIGLNRDYTFPLKDGSGKVLSNIHYVITEAQVRDEIIVKGQKANAVGGKTFLILELKIRNDFNQGVDINTRDYVRLSVNDNGEELLAPEIHNDPVNVQATSIKYTRLGFAINQTDKNFILHIGEIGEKKEKLPLPLSIK